MITENLHSCPELLRDLRVVTDNVLSFIHKVQQTKFQCAAVIGESWRMCPPPFVLLYVATRGCYCTMKSTLKALPMNNIWHFHSCFFLSEWTITGIFLPHYSQLLKAHLSITIRYNHLCTTCIERKPKRIPVKEITLSSKSVTTDFEEKCSGGFFYLIIQMVESVFLRKRLTSLWHSGLILQEI